MEIQLPLPLDRELPKPSYYNTVGLVGEKLKERKLRANSLANEVLHIFAYNPQVSYTAWEVYDKIQGNRPVTSVRRAISDLVEGDFLEYTGNVKVSGPYNEDCKLVKLNPNHL